MLDRLKMTAQSMINRMAELDTVANNLANVSTKGYKRDELFSNELERRLASSRFPGLKPNTHIPQVEAVIDFSQGPLVGTGEPLNVAISGAGLFVVETPDGEAYTRDGRFTLNSEGILTTLEGLPVLGEGGAIEINLLDKKPSQIVIHETGDLLVDGVVIDTLRVVAVEEPQDFVKTGGNLFQLSDPAKTPEPALYVLIKQGFLEESNVNPIAEMTAMIDIFQAFRTSEKMIQSQDSLLGRAVNDIGKVQY